MAINREKYKEGDLRVVENPESVGLDDSPPRSVAGKFGDFIAPTLTDTVRDIQKKEGVSFKQAAGSAMELGSVFLPAGWIFKGLTAGSRAIKLTQATKKARKADIFEDLSDKGRKARDIAKAFGRKTKRAAMVGGVSGGLAGGGRALGEDDITPTEFAGQIAIGGGVGVVAGGALPAIGAPFSLAKAGSKGLYRITSRSLKKVQSQLNPEDAQTAKRVLAESYENSFVADKPAVNKKLDSIVNSARRKGGPQNKQELLEELSEGGFVPKIEGKLANMNETIDEITDRIAQRAEWRNSFLEPIKKKVSLSQIKKEAQDAILERTDIDADRALRQLDNVIKSLQTRLGKTVTASDLNRISMQMNKSTKAFNKEQFIFDTQVAIGRVANRKIDELIGESPAVRTLNKDMSKLFRMKDTSSVFHNRAIDEGEFVKTIGRGAGLAILGTPLTIGIGAVAAGFGGAVSGGSLFIAALAAQQGARFTANLVRNARFNPRVQEKIRQAIDMDKQLKDKLLKESKGKDKKVLDALFSGDEVPN